MGITLRFQSELAVSPEQLWQWIASEQGIRREMRPWLRMRFPAGITSLEQVDVEPGKRVFRSWLLVFGFLPVGVSQLTFTEWLPGSGFTEQSPMTGVRSWRHQRIIEPTEGGSKLVDEVTVAPLLLPGLTRAITSAFFGHRHRRLRQAFSVIERT